MDYEKKYKEALSRARAKYAMRDQPIHQDLVDIFPELAENEDQRVKDNIKKVIGWYRGLFTEKSLMPEEYQEIDVWLKKQGEQKPAETKGMNLEEESMTPFQKKVFCIIDTAIEEEQGLKQVCDELLALASDEIKQKPAWSEEDEKILNSIISHFEEGHVSTYENRKTIDWLKFLRPQSHQRPSDEHYELEEFAKIVRGNLTGISKAVQKLFEAKYLQLTGNKVYGEFKD